MCVMIMHKSIFGRMFWTYAIILLVVFSTIAAAMSVFFTRYNTRKQIETMVSVAHTVEYWAGILQIEQTDARSAYAFSQILYSWSKFTLSDITVVGREGEVFDSTAGVRSVPDGLMDCVTNNETTVHRSDYNGFYRTRVISVGFPMTYKDNVIGAVFFAKHMDDVRRTVMELIVMFIFSCSFAMLFAFILVYIQAKKITAPIININKAAQKIAAGNFGERVEVTSHDEIGQLASTFNFMASSIEKSEKHRQSFISDVSHELRTPMTSISGFVQGMLDGTIPDDKRDDYLQIVLDESTRLTKLVNDMLEMSKMSSDEFKLDITPFDINELICKCLISLESRIDAKRIEVNVDFRPDRLITLGDKYQIQRVLLNLLDNAIKFCHEGTEIQINTWIAGGKAHVSVSDTGDLLTDSEMKSLFDRFFKTDKSRNKDRSGAGLGLSLVRNIIRLHKQTIDVSCKPLEDGKSGITKYEFTLEVQ